MNLLEGANPASFSLLQLLLLGQSDQRLSLQLIDSRTAPPKAFNLVGECWNALI
jgi:hypothetical protein